MRAVVHSALLVSIIFFTLGLIYPIIATKQQVLGIVFKYQEIRLLDSIGLFFDEGDYLLAGIILVFTVLFPILKFLELGNRSFHLIKISIKTSNVLHALDKWSMLDVFLVALILLNFKLDSDIVVMKLESGTTFIALSVIFRMLYSQIVHFQNKSTT